MTRHLLTATIHGAALCVSMWFMSQAYLEGKRVSEEAETERANLYAVSKMFDADKAKQESIKAYTELETKRTSVQHEIRKIVIAEWKKCKRSGCK